MKWIPLFTLAALCIGFAGGGAATKAETAENHKIADGVYIGNVYVGGMTEEEAKAEQKKNNHVIKDGDKGYRRIIAAPRPMEIYELDAIKALLDADQVVIACGGGGIPVLQQGTRLKGASAVIEKDLTSACLAEGIQADMLLLLTGVEKVALNFNTPQETPLDHLSVEEATKYIEDGQFTTGAMLPKIEAAVSFASSSPAHKSVITDLDTALDGVTGKTGTLITAD